MIIKDYRVFRKKENNSEEYEEVPKSNFSIESDLEDVCVLNINTFLDMFHIDNQVPLETTTFKGKLKIDHLCFDYDKRPVIIEYKRTPNQHIISQTTHYKTVIMNLSVKYDLTKRIIEGMKQNHKIDIKFEEIDWDNIRSICFAPTFTAAEIFDIEYDDRYTDLEFIEYKILDTSHLSLTYYFLKNNTNPKWMEPTKISIDIGSNKEEKDRPIKVTDLEKLQDPVWKYYDIYKQLIDWSLKTISFSITPKGASGYVSYFKGSTKCFDLAKKEDRLEVIVNVTDKSKIQYIDGIIIDTSKMARYHRGSTTINVRDSDSLEKAKTIIYQNCLDNSIIDSNENGEENK